MGPGMALTRWGLWLACCALAACSSGGADPSSGPSALDIVRGQIANLRGTAAASQVTLSAAQLRAFPQDLLVVRLPLVEASAGLVQQAVNRDTVTWVTPDGLTVILRAGQVIGTAGFGNDLASADLDDPRDGTGRTVRDYFYLGGDEQIARRRFLCDVTSAGRQPVVVAGVQFDTTLLQEACEDSDGIAIFNRYWVQSDGRIRKSVQFISPRVGYMIVEDIHGGLR